MIRLINAIFGCTHRRYTWPRGRVRTHVVCLDCGKELPYSWEDMKVVA